MSYLVPELQDSDWELDYVELGSDEVPEKRDEVWLIESYHFTHSEKDITLYCNMEVNPDDSRSHEVNVQVRDEDPLILNFSSRREWWTGIKQILADENSEVKEVIEG